MPPRRLCTCPPLPPICQRDRNGSIGFVRLRLAVFGRGDVFMLSLEAAILSRLRTGTPVNAPVRGIVGIQLAPAFVGCGAYFAVSGGHIDTFSLL